MYSKIISHLNSSKYTYNFANVVEKSKFIFTLSSLILLVTFITEEFDVANASLNLDDFMQQTQENIQSAIESNNANNNNECNNNISIQSQTNENGRTTSTTKSICDDVSTTTTSTANTAALSTSDNLNGSIVSSEYNQNTGLITHSIFGNWSMTTKSDGSKDFSSNFVKQPLSYGNQNNTLTDESNTSSSSSTSVSSTISPSSNVSTVVTPSENVNATQASEFVNNSNTTSYTLSNFIVNSVQQQNNDIIYSGNIDVVQEITFSNSNMPDEVNNFKGIGVSISVVDNKVLIITFDNESQLAQEFSNIPLVGLIS